MPVTRTTRRGNGAGKGDGWGGPAKGASTRRIRPGDPDGIQAMSTDAEVKAKAARRLARVKARIFRLAMRAEREETQLSACIAFANREEGTPIQRQDVTSKGAQIGYVIAAPEEDETPDAWQARQDTRLLQ